MYYPGLFESVQNSPYSALTAAAAAAAAAASSSSSSSSGVTAPGTAHHHPTSSPSSHHHGAYAIKNCHQSVPTVPSPSTSTTSNNHVTLSIDSSSSSLSSLSDAKKMIATSTPPTGSASVISPFGGSFRLAANFCQTGPAAVQSAYHQRVESTSTVSPYGHVPPPPPPPHAHSHYPATIPDNYHHSTIHHHVAAIEMPPAPPGYGPAIRSIPDYAAAAAYHFYMSSAGAPSSSAPHPAFKIPITKSEPVASGSVPGTVPPPTYHSSNSSFYHANGKTTPTYQAAVPPAPSHIQHQPTVAPPAPTIYHHESSSFSIPDYLNHHHHHQASVNKGPGATPVVSHHSAHALYVSHQSGIEPANSTSSTSSFSDHLRKLQESFQISNQQHQQTNNEKDQSTIMTNGHHVHSASHNANQSTNTMSKSSATVWNPLMDASPRKLITTTPTTTTNTTIINYQPQTSSFARVSSGVNVSQSPTTSSSSSSIKVIGKSKDELDDDDKSENDNKKIFSVKRDVDDDYGDGQVHDEQKKCQVITKMKFENKDDENDVQKRKPNCKLITVDHANGASSSPAIDCKKSFKRRRSSSSSSGSIEQATNNKLKAKQSDAVDENGGEWSSKTVHCDNVNANTDHNKKKNALAAHGKIIENGLTATTTTSAPASAQQINNKGANNNKTEQTKTSSKKSSATMRRRRFRSGLDMIRNSRKKTSKAKSSKEPNCTTGGGGSGANNKKESSDNASNRPEVRRLMVNKSLGETLLHRSARNNRLEVIRQCLEYEPCDVNARDNAGYTPLHECSSRGHLEVARLLLQHSADVNASATGGIRPLHDAIENNHIEMVRLLLSYGADPYISTYSGTTPLQLSRSKAMTKFLKGFYRDINSERSTQLVNQPIDEQEDPEEYVWTFKFDSQANSGFDIFDDLPDDDDEPEPTMEDEQFIMQLSCNPFVNLYTFLHRSNQCPFYLLWDVIKTLKMTRDGFIEKYPHVTIAKISQSDYLNALTAIQLETRSNNNNNIKNMNYKRMMMDDSHHNHSGQQQQQSIQKEDEHARPMIEIIYQNEQINRILQIETTTVI